MGRRWDNSNGCDDNGRWEVLNWDICKWDVLDYFLEPLVDVGILRLRVGVFELRTNNIVLLGGDISKNLEKVGWGGNKGG